MTTLNEGRHPGEAVMTEANGNRSRESLTIAAEQTIEANTILAKRAVAADVVATPSAAVGNTASAGTVAMGTPPVTSKVKDGRYKGIAVTATTVSWEDPDGKEIGVSTHGTEFSKGGVKFTITAGGSANVAGDEFYIDVAADAEDFEHIAYAVADGLPIGGIAIYPATTGASETAKIAAIVRDAEVNGHCIAWPAGITAAQKADATQELAAIGIIVRN
ncbi:conserved hypothetical protein [Nitrobacter hamburgensis X14]|uniref:Head decoration protein n=1 Tax=Nitrobacter hamburgensis (strain DSM 10229 / NCIMB 13809 / X14) TaxID=323097 RepID=Q1QKR8_NITHX|nr:head decoration protein [Nitrobacter hamburgensis]ABE63179.1 conserved hypothetical protein [Nitrobacter hamburgensis X14]